MLFAAGKDIRVYAPTDEFRQWCKSELVINNPEYIKKVRLGKWLGDTPKTVSLYEDTPGVTIVPFGMLKTLFQRYGSNNQFKPEFEAIRAVDYKSSINPYDYQKEAIEKAIEAKNGVIVMPCGAGKTQTALELVARIGGRCLWLTHTQDLLNQSMNRAKSCFGLPVKDFGTITSGKVNIQKITFATVQTMCNIDLPKYEKMFDVVIVDECHRCIGSPTRVMQFYKVLTSICARYKFGLTATPKRSDGLEKSMYALLGGIVYEVSKDAVKDTRCPVKVITYKTGYIPNLDLVLSGDGTLNYSALVDDLIENEERFNFVGNIINRNTEGATLVLGNRVKYLQELCECYDGKAVCLSTMGNSRSAKEERKNVLKQLNNGEIDCVFATYQLAKEGLDVPNLRCVVLATPEKDETTVTQATGRVGRKVEGKEYGVVIDFSDSFGLFNGWEKKRKKYYKTLEYEVYE